MHGGSAVKKVGQTISPPVGPSPDRVVTAPLSREALGGIIKKKGVIGRKRSLLLADKAAHLKNTYGMTLFEYEYMMRRQGGKCAICRQVPKKGKFLAVDHDHYTGEVRGLLCYMCNGFLGRMDDDTVAVARAVKYLSNYWVRVSRRLKVQTRKDETSSVPFLLTKKFRKRIISKIRKGGRNE